MKVNKKEFEDFLKIHKTVDMLSAKWKIINSTFMSAISTQDRTVIGMAKCPIQEYEGEDTSVAILNTGDLLKSITILDETYIEIKIDRTYLYLYSNEWTIKLMLAVESMIPKRSMLTTATKKMIDDSIDANINLTSEVIKKLKKVYSMMDKPEFINFKDGNITIVKDANESHKVDIKYEQIQNIDITFSMSILLDIMNITEEYNLDISKSQNTCKIGSLYFKSL